MLFMHLPFIVISLYFYAKGLQSGSSTPTKSIQQGQVSTANACGLKNLANTCYMNAVLQSTFGCSRYRENIINRVYKPHSVGHELQKLFVQMSTGPKQPVDTSSLAELLDVNIYEQADAEEMFLNLINAVDASVIKGDLRKPSFPFAFTVRNTLNCTNITYAKHKIESHIDLSLDVRGFKTLDKALDAHFQEEQLRGINKYRTAEFGFQNAIKVSRIFLEEEEEGEEADRPSVGPVEGMSPSVVPSSLPAATPPHPTPPTPPIPPTLPTYSTRPTSPPPPLSQPLPPVPLPRQEKLFPRGLPETIVVHLKRFAWDAAIGMQKVS
jgi:hypothetical protein